MKTGIEVKDDGLIYLIPDTDAFTPSILVSDQKEAKRFVWYNQTGGYVNIHDFVLKPGIYPIPDLKWEVRTIEKFYEGKGWFWETVAILKESTPSTEQESQEELTALDLKMFIERELGGYKTVHMGRSYRVINRQFVYESDIMSLAEDLLRNFTITRNQ